MALQDVGILAFLLSAAEGAMKLPKMPRQYRAGRVLDLRQHFRPSRLPFG